VASIFSRIISGEIPCHKVYEDASVFAFLDVNPLADGHTLVVPKREVEQLYELSPDECAAIGRVLPMLVQRVLNATGAEGCNVLQNNGKAAGQQVPHVHFHIIPRRSGDQLGYRWNAGKRSEQELAAMAAKLRAE
jgi:histidine triad (HIT) family protein